MKSPIVAILAGHHGIGTGASSFGRDEWSLARGDALEPYLQLSLDGIITPVLEPIAEDNDAAESAPLIRAARWALSQGAAAAIDLHYNSYETTFPSGHLVCSSRMTPFVECMARALDVLPNKRRDTIINSAFILPRLMDPIPCVLLEPAFIFESCVGLPDWRALLVAAIKGGLYKYFAGGE